MRRLRPPPMEGSRSSSSSAQRQQHAPSGQEEAQPSAAPPSSEEDKAAHAHAQQLAGCKRRDRPESQSPWQSATFWQRWPTRRPDRWRYPPLYRGHPLFNPGLVPRTIDAGTSVSLLPAARAGATGVELRRRALAGCQHAGEVELSLTDTRHTKLVRGLLGGGPLANKPGLALLEEYSSRTCCWAQC